MIVIDGKKINNNSKKTILEIALENNIQIPNMCFESRLEPYGGCGMCVVEVKGMSKLQRACSTKALDDMEITTDSPRVMAARKLALDLYVSDHRGDCIPPCTLNCPARTDIQGYVGLVANGQPVEALKLIKEAIPIPASIGRICPHPCESACRRDIVDEPISIASIKFYAADVDLANDKQYVPTVEEDTSKSVSVVGAGPAGLSCAYFLRRKGHSVTIYEAMPKPGGMLRYGIPEYRLPKSIIDQEVELIKDLGVNIEYEVKVGKDITLDELEKNSDAVFLGIGAWKSSSMRCEGENLPGVMGGIDFLQKVELGEKIILDDEVLVVGGGNTAMDVARTCIRLGKKVTVLYRRTEEQMPARDIEIEEAKEEGVIFEFLVAPIKVIDESGAAGLICQKMQLGEPDDSGRRRPVPIEGEVIEYKSKSIISAIGQKVDLGDIEIDTTDWGTIVTDDKTYQTSISKVFSGGDAVTGPQDAIDAIAAGKNAAKVIDSFLLGDLIPHYEQRLIERDDMVIDDYPNVEILPRVENELLDSKERIKNFDAVMCTYSDDEAILEGTRCLECGCKDVFECELLEGIRDYSIDTSKKYIDTHRRVLVDDHPYIQRDIDKCIQCAQCVRICDELIGSTALGISNRGFDSEVIPEFNKKLSDTDCVSCGACIDACPTGALKEKLLYGKDIPLNLRQVDSYCTACSMLCEVTYHLKGDRIYKVTARNDPGVLCVKGKFEFEHFNISQNELESDIKRNKIGIVIDPVISNEEMKEIKKLNNVVMVSGTATHSCNERLSNKDEIKEIVSFDSDYKNYVNITSKDNSFAPLEEFIKLVKSGDVTDCIFLGNEVPEILKSVGLKSISVISLFEEDNCTVYIKQKGLLETGGTVTDIFGNKKVIKPLIEDDKTNIDLIKEIIN